MNEQGCGNARLASITDLFSEANVFEALREVYDPELGVNIVDLGLVYGVEINGADIRIRMTLTTPGCPLHDMLAEAVDDAMRLFLGASGNVDVQLVWDPRWRTDMITPAGLHELGWR